MYAFTLILSLSPWLINPPMTFSFYSPVGGPGAERQTSSKANHFWLFSFIARAKGEFRLPVGTKW